MLFGIVGSLGAGKGTVVEYLKQQGFEHYSVSGELKKMLDSEGTKADRKNLSALADELAQEYDGGILEVIYKQIAEDVEKNVILESIHRETEAEYLRSVGAIIIAVDADKKIRYERAVQRQEGEKDNVTYEQFLTDIEREEEGKGSGTPNIREVIKNADFLIQNDGTLKELHQQVDAVLKSLEI